jgi:hypothetical protein
MTQTCAHTNRTDVPDDTLASLRFADLALLLEGAKK